MRIFQSEQVIKLRNVLVSLKKNEWPPNSPDLSPLDYHVWDPMLDAIRNTCQNSRTLPNCKLPCYRYGMICHRSSVIRQSCHFERDFDRVLLELVDILNTQFKYREGSWNSSPKRLNCWRKRCAKFDSILLNIQDAAACSLEKVNFKL